ncbi:hypothetical protein HGG76_10415 [Ochrobactrum tritici]|uniref:Uncharacterized protein n=1 Tax=Brucella tritici TaxID=94626 RepID=A0A7X6FQ72_9HYPH|nr:hypothetical protein [Brucella tritici]
MISGKRLKFMIIDEVGQAHPPRWSHPFSRFGCARSRRVLERFLKKQAKLRELPSKAARVFVVERRFFMPKKRANTILGMLIR